MSSYKFKIGEVVKSKDAEWLIRGMPMYQTFEIVAYCDQTGHQSAGDRCYLVRYDGEMGTHRQESELRRLK